VSTAGIILAAWFQQCNVPLIRVSIHRFIFVKAFSWLLSTIIKSYLTTEGSGDSALVILSRVDGGEVMMSKVLEEETQVNNQVLSQKSLVQLFWWDVEVATTSGVI
jgi:hypothetical protein